MSSSAAPERRRSPLVESVLAAAIVVTKIATLLFAIDGFLHHDSPRLRGKAIRTRLAGCVAAMMIIPLVWRLIPDRGRYPRGLDLAVTVPLVLDAGGNAFGLYDSAHIDDVVHVANSAIVTAIAGALIAPHVDERWHAAAAGAGVAIVGESAWEIMEYTALQLGATGMDLSYGDTIGDMADGFLGAIVGGVFTVWRLPRHRPDRQQAGWRTTLGLRHERPA
jgi:hypothetical protein